MKRTIVSLAILLAATALSAQSLLSFGLRGGLDFMMPQSECKTKPKLGAAGLLDIGYTFYYPTFYAGDWGFHVGVSGGYSMSESRLMLMQQYTNHDYMDNEMLYTTSGTIGLGMKRFYGEVPYMVAFRLRGLVVQAGAKVQYSFWSEASQRAEKVSIDAYYVPYDVHVTDTRVTGVITGSSQAIYKDGAPKLSVLAAFRAGYEQQMSDMGRFGIMACLDFGVWNSGIVRDTSGKPVVAVSPIDNPKNPVAEVRMNNAFALLCSGISSIQVGICLYYGLEFPHRK